MSFLTAEDIANRALQHCGLARIGSLSSDRSPAAKEISFTYDKVRQAELRRNPWKFAIKRAVVRPIDTNCLLFIPPAWAIGTAYQLAAIVSYSGLYYQAQQAGTGQQPDIAPAYWQPYYGPLMATPWTAGTLYYNGELVYRSSGTSDYQVYVSLASSNNDTPGDFPAWDTNTVYMTGDTVALSLGGLTFNGQPVTYNGLTIDSAQAWVSSIDANLGNSPSGGVGWTALNAPYPITEIVDGKWLLLQGATVKALKITYPAQSGPASDQSSRNVYMLPNGFLRRCAQDPTAGVTPYLGAPRGLAATDWEFEGQYVVSSEPDHIMVRFIADITSVPAMDPMFCEGLAARIAHEVAPILVETKPAIKRQEIMQAYREVMGEARAVNGIESAPEEPPEDDYILARV